MAPGLNELAGSCPTGDGAAADIDVVRQISARLAKNLVQRIKRPGERWSQNAQTPFPRTDLLDDFQGAAELVNIDAGGRLLANDKNKERTGFSVAGAKNEQAWDVFPPVGTSFLLLSDPEISWLRSAFVLTRKVQS